MRVRMLYFAWVREAVGTGEEVVEMPETLESVAELVAWLAAKGAGYGVAFADISRLRAAVDGTFVPFDANIGAEVAIFPPVTGG